MQVATGLLSNILQPTCYHLVDNKIRSQGMFKVNFTGLLQLVNKLINFIKSATSLLNQDCGNLLSADFLSADLLSADLLQLVETTCG